MVKLGIANSRMKDFYDLEVLSRIFSFDANKLLQAIQNTFDRRGTELPVDGSPLAFTPDFCEDASKIRQWTAYLQKNSSYIEQIELKALIARISRFLVPILNAARHGQPFTKAWKPSGPWVEYDRHSSLAASLDRGPLRLFGLALQLSVLADRESTIAYAVHRKHIRGVSQEVVMKRRVSIALALMFAV